MAGYWICNKLGRMWDGLSWRNLRYILVFFLGKTGFKITNTSG